MSLVEKTLEKVLEQRRAAAATNATGDREAELHRATDRNPLATPAAVARTESARLPVSAKKVRIRRDTLRRDGLLPSAQDERLVAHQFMRIKRPLIENAFGRDSHARDRLSNLVMVSSALPGDGKTFTAMNLALSFGRETDSAVLLVDGDVAKAHISRALGLEHEPGLMDALREGRDVDPMIVGTDIEGLSVLPAGAGSERATEFLASDRMLTLLHTLCAARSDRIVVFDTPPLLLTNEAPMLARRAGQIVLVVRAGMTPKQAVLDAVALLDTKKFIGLVFNQSRRRATDSYGYYGYGQHRDSSSTAHGSTTEDG